MARVTVVLPVGITYPEQQSEMVLDAATVGDTLAAVIKAQPRLEARIFGQGKLIIALVLNGELMRPADALATPVADGDRLSLVPPVAGG